MSRFNDFFSKAVANMNNVSLVETPRPTTSLEDAYSSIANFVNGALSRVQLTSYIFVSGKGLISISGRESSENLSILPGYYYFGNNTVENLWETSKIYKFDYAATTQVINLTTNGEEAVGFLLTLSATNQTNGQITIDSTFDGYTTTREIMIDYINPVQVFIPCRNHAINQDVTFSVSGTGTSLDPFILDADNDVTLEKSQAIMSPRIVAATGDNVVKLSAQAMYVEVEVLPNYYTYLQKLFK